MKIHDLIILMSQQEKHVNIQDAFLNHIRKNKIPVTVFLINGVKLQGGISSFDNNTILLKREGHVQLIYKHAVSTLMPHGPVQLFDNSSDEYEEEDVAHDEILF